MQWIFDISLYDAAAIVRWHIAIAAQGSSHAHPENAGMLLARHLNRLRPADFHSKHEVRCFPAANFPDPIAVRQNSVATLAIPGSSLLIRFDLFAAFHWRGNKRPSRQSRRVAKLQAISSVNMLKTTIYPHLFIGFCMPLTNCIVQ